MKGSLQKLTCVALVFFGIVSLASCGKYSLKQKTAYTYSAAQSFFEGKEKVSAGDLNAKFKVTLTREYYDEDLNVTFGEECTVKGAFAGADLKYTATRRNTETKVFLGGRYESTVTVKEKFTRVGGVAYVSLSESTKNSYETFSSNGKFLGEDASSILPAVNDLIAAAKTLLSYPFGEGCYFYIDGDDMTVVKDPTAGDPTKEETILLYKGARLTDMRHTATDAGYKLVIELNVGKAGRIKAPADAAVYKAG